MSQCGTVIGPFPDLFLASTLLVNSMIQVNGEEPLILLTRRHIHPSACFHSTKK